MGINDIREIDSLLTERMANVRRVERREGESGGSSREFQQVFEFARNSSGEEAEKKPKTPPTEAPKPARALTLEEVEAARRRDDTSPGQLIDIEA